MTAAAFTDGIEVTLALDGGRVRDVAITTRRPTGIVRLAQGRDGEAVAAIVPRLFSLCAVAQGAAVTAALDAARGGTPPGERAVARAAAVMSERMVELLRAMLTASAGPALAEFAAPLRRLADGARRFDGSGLPAAGRMAAAIEEIDGGLDGLGLRGDCLGDADACRHWLQGRSPLAALLRPTAAEDAAFGAIDVDPLGSGDDVAVAEGLGRDGIGFATRPGLDGRVPETGALARWAGHPAVAGLGTGLLGRLLARLAEVRATPARLQRLIDGDADPADTVRALPLGAGIGLGAVECARGRLYHRVELAPDGRVARLDILAPTEWNFHPRGPLVRALTGLPLAAVDGDRARVGRLAGAFDPCVAYRVRFAEAGHA